MKKEKSTEILLEPVKYWEKKLNINYDTEFIRYKRLCAKLTKKEMLKLDGCYYITHSEWKEHIINTIEDLDCPELQEYIHFLKSQSLNGNISFNLAQTILIPCVLGLLNALVSCSFSLTNYPEELSKPVSIIIFFFLCLIIFGGFYAYFFHTIKKLFITSKDNSLRCSFYSDMLEIAEKRFKKCKKKKQLKSGPS